MELKVWSGVGERERERRILERIVGFGWKRRRERREGCWCWSWSDGVVGTVGVDGVVDGVDGKIEVVWMRSLVMIVM